MLLTLRRFARYLFAPYSDEEEPKGRYVMSENQKSQDQAPEVQTQPVQQEPVKKTTVQEQVTIAAQIMAVLGDTPEQAMTNAQIRTALAMRSSKGKGQGKGATEAQKKAELDKVYKALHPTMQRLAAQRLVFFYKKGNGRNAPNAYYRAPA